MNYQVTYYVKNQARTQHCNSAKEVRQFIKGMVIFVVWSAAGNNVTKSFKKYSYV